MNLVSSRYHPFTFRCTLVFHRVKLPVLNGFHERLEEPGWTFTGNSDTEKDKILMVEFNVVITEFLKLKKPYQTIIKQICKEMGAGMAEFAGRRKGEVDTTKDYNLYCHYVAGLVGIGLSRLFAASGLEDSKIGTDDYCSNSMGLFLQKTNIIRDYLEDLDDGRTWYPKEVCYTCAYAIELNPHMGEGHWCRLCNQRS